MSIIHLYLYCPISFIARFRSFWYYHVGSDIVFADGGGVLRMHIIIILLRIYFRRRVKKSEPSGNG
jgi:hypothetical protein